MIRLAVSFLSTVTLVALVLKFNSGFAKDVRAVGGTVTNFETTVLSGGANQGHH